MKTQRITVALPRPLIRRVKQLAEEKGTSVSSLATTALEDLVRNRDDYERAKESALARMRNPPNLGTHGLITWSRDSLHERR